MSTSSATRGRRSPVRVRLPSFAGGELPPREPERQRRVVQATALATLALTAAYLLWRVTSTMNLGVWWVSIPLLLVELHNALGLALFTRELWNLDTDPPPAPVHRTPLAIAILIPTFNEPEDVLLPTVAAAVALQPGHETWILDDGRRPWVRALAEDLGARYLTRADNRNAKAGNLNHALNHIRADIVAVLDADHVATEGFLANTLGYFADDRVAVVQTPQDFYNRDSFEHEGANGARGFNEEAVFYRIIEAGKQHWGSAFWCGTGALVRVAALRSIGGVAVETVTEDLHTTIRLDRLGWRVVYHNEVLVHGLAPGNASQYWVQRNRWARGAMQVVQRESPFGPGLTLNQRLSFATTLFGWFDSWRMFAYIVLPVTVIVTGAVPIAAPGYLYGPLFVATLGSQFIAMRLLARGYYPPLLSMLFEVLRMPAVLPATLSLLAPPGRADFKVTNKGSDGNAAVSVPPLLGVLASLSAAALAWFAATLGGLTPTTYAEPAAAAGAACFSAWNLGLLLAAVRRIRSRRFVHRGREAFRFAVAVPGELAGIPCEVDNLSLSGARVLGPRGRSLAGHDIQMLDLDFGSRRVALRARVVRAGIATEGRMELGLAFEPGQRRELAEISRLLLSRGRTGAPHSPAQPTAA